MSLIIASVLRTDSEEKKLPPRITKNIFSETCTHFMRLSRVTRNGFAQASRNPRSLAIHATLCQRTKYIVRGWHDLVRVF